jgi:DNA invertase Pin-like site-specific DNA recombinase
MFARKAMPMAVSCKTRAHNRRMKLIAYARVSTSGQTLNAQLEQLGAHGCDLIFQETMSGARADDRPQLRKALAALGEDDTLVVTRLDRLARSTFDLLTIVRDIETKGARLKSLADSWANTTTPTGRLILTVLGGLAEFERERLVSPPLLR